MRVAGIHSPNNSGVYQEDIDAWVRITPGVILLCQPYMNIARELKERIPGVYIVGRVFGGSGFDAWHPQWLNADWMYRYGVFCGEMANQFAVDCIQFANEPGIDDNNPWMWSREGYEAQAYGSEHWLRGFRSVTTKEAGTCVQSPGHHFDDDPNGWGWTGAGIVKDVWQQFDIHLAHAYITRDPATIESEWWGRRYRRERDALGWTKRLIVTETNRDEPTPPTDADRISLAENYRQWYANSEVESCFFIWDTADPNFARLTMKHNRWLIDVATHANAAVVPQEEPTMPKPTSLSINALPPVRPGDSLAVSGNASGIDGVAMLTARIALPAKPDGYAYGADTVASGIPIAPDGSFLFPIQIPTVTENLDARLILNTVELDPSAGAFDAAEASFPVKIIANASEVPWTPQPVALPPAYDIMFQRAGDVINAAEAVGDTELAELGRDIHRTIVRRKEGR